MIINIALEIFYNLWIKKSIRNIEIYNIIDQLDNNEICDLHKVIITIYNEKISI